LPTGIPSYDTVGRVFAALDPEPFETGFLGWVQALAMQDSELIIALEARPCVARMTGRTAKGALQLVRAWATTNPLLLG
jgi:hypothetical protein